MYCQISSSLSASSDGGESGISLRLENFEEIKQKFESLAESKDSKDVVPRARRGSAVNLGTAGEVVHTFQYPLIRESIM